MTVLAAALIFLAIVLYVLASALWFARRTRWIAPYLSTAGLWLGGAGELLAGITRTHELWQVIAGAFFLTVAALATAALITRHWVERRRQEES